MEDNAKRNTEHKSILVGAAKRLRHACQVRDYAM